MIGIKQEDRKKTAVLHALKSENPVVRDALERLLVAVEMAHGDELEPKSESFMFPPTLQVQIMRALKQRGEKARHQDVVFLDYESDFFFEMPSATKEQR